MGQQKERETMQEQRYARRLSTNIHTDIHADPQTRVRLSRRAFLGNLAAALAGGLVAACAAPANGQNGWPVPENAPPVALASPRPPSTPTPVAEDLPLAQFLALSALLTGVGNLDPVLGRVYLQSLQQSNQFELTVADLLAQSGFGSAQPPTTFDELSATAIFDNAPSRNLADKIIEYWYTGIYETAEGEQAVATFVDALAWSTLSFTKPATICGSPGFWAVPPREPLASRQFPGVQYAAAPCSTG
jgi:hypothetical protein